MADQQERLQKIASTFGDSDINIFYKRDKVYPDKAVSEETVDKIEAALRSPELEPSSVRVTQGKEVLYRSYQGEVTNDVKGVAGQFQAPKASYFDLLKAQTNKTPGYFDNEFTPESVNQKINTPDTVYPQSPKFFGEFIDRLVLSEAIDRGMSKDEALKLVAEQSPHVANLSKDQARFPKAFQSYVAPEDGALSREYDAVLENHTKSAEVNESIPQAEPQLETKSPELVTPQPSTLPELDLSALSNGNLSQPLHTKNEQIKSAIEPKLAEQLRQQASTQAERGGEIVLVTQSKALIPLEPTAKQLNEKMPEVLSPQPVAVAKSEPIVSTPKPEPVASASNESLEKALAAANSRLDALQTQLSSTQGALEDLSKHVKESNLKTWATNTAQKIGTTVQTIAAQAKTKVVDWVTQAKVTVEQKATQVKKAAQNIVGNVKTAAQDKVERVKTATQLKSIEVRETARHRINDVLSPVDSAALTATANRVISEWGKDGKFEGNTFNFQRSQSGDVSIHTKDGAAVFANGVVTDKATPQTIAHLSQLPRRMEVTQNYTPTQTPSVKQAFAR